MLRRSRRVLLTRQILARPERRDGSTRRRRHANVARFRPEQSAVIDRVTGFVLPLMHHLVQQRVEDFGPTVSAEVPSVDGNLPWFAPRRG